MLWINGFLAGGGGNAIDAFAFHAYNCVNGDLWLARQTLSDLRYYLEYFGGITTRNSGRPNKAITQPITVRTNLGCKAAGHAPDDGLRAERHPQGAQHPTGMTGATVTGMRPCGWRTTTAV